MKRKIAAALIAIGVIVGTYLSGLFQGIGGGGDGAIPGTTQTSAVPDANDAPVPETPKPAPESEPATSETASDSDQGKVLRVRIQGEKYLVQRGSGDAADFREVELGKLVEFAKSMPGNERGVRVHIQRDPSALAIVWRTLREELNKAGLSDQSLEWQDDPAP